MAPVMKDDLLYTAENKLLLDKTLWKPWPGARARVKGCLACVKQILFKIGDDWFFLFALGVITALISFTMDFIVAKMLNAHRWLYQELGDNMLLKYLSWTVYPTAMTAFSTGFAQSVSPQSAGSGIPELKTILTGVVLEEYLTVKNMGAKIVGMTCTLAAGSPIFLGKVGPFVHLSSMIATYLGRIRASVTKAYENKSKQYEMLVAAAAVGVASCFGAPISGVLFSVEVMSSHFAVRNYWRGFFAATCGAFVFRLLAVFNSEQETILALFKTSFKIDFPFDLPEMVFFIILGAICGGVSCAYLFCQRWLLGFNRRNKIIVSLLATDKVVYSALVAILVSSMTFPYGLGQFMASRLTMKELLTSFFDNRTWIVLSKNASLPRPPSVDPNNLWIEWWDPTITIYGTLLVFIVMKFWMLILATTMPMPAGYFMPVFIYGAALGRLVGELIVYFFPDGIKADGVINPIIPGGYALAGAAAFSGAVTHTLSTALLVFEMTGQMAHFLPVLLAVLVANAISQKCQPSFYDGTIIVKKLPYLPRLHNADTGSYSVTTQQFMSRHFFPVMKSWGCNEVVKLLTSSTDAEFPVVNGRDAMVLLGSIPRAELLRFLRYHQRGNIGEENTSRQESAEGERPETTSLAEVCAIQPVTFQLSPQTSLHQAHSLFELLGVQFMYVTNAGALVGLVTRKELRAAIEDLALGKIPLST
ncbi:chloride channel K [Erpetoichthys calabaricus]|uniref:chloride channel K n=1 Tax=Erpetoichthys calabaricus TaxID=27687 RepID=UPI002234574D|nr:chloride channel K [Erpetoichthys calabaricus]